MSLQELENLLKSESLINLARFKLNPIKMLKKYFRYGYTLLITTLKPVVVKTAPIHIQLEPTNNCNLRCIMCTREKQIEKPKNMTLDEFKEIIDSIRPLKITLSGLGEPFLNPWLLRMIAYAKSNGASVNTTSNFTLTKGKGEEIVKSGLDLIKISIDAAKDDTYRRIRGEDKFDVIINNIKELISARKALHSAKPCIRFQFVIQKENYREMGDIISLAHKIGVDSVFFQPLEIIGNKENSLISGLSIKELKKEFSRGYKLSKKLKVSTNLNTLLRYFDRYSQLYFNQNKVGNTRECFYPWFSMYILADGDVWPCCSFALNYNHKKPVMGNVLFQDIWSIWNGKKYQELRKGFKKGKILFNRCRNCIPETVSFYQLFESIRMAFP